MKPIDNLVNFTVRKRAGRVALIGRYVSVRPVDWSIDLTDLTNHLCAPGTDGLWDHMGFGPFQNGADMQATMEMAASQSEWEVMSLIQSGTDEAIGSASFMRNREADGSVEIGCVLFGHELQRTRMATEAIYLMMAHVFDELGYRRLEWKCDSINSKSHAAALRFGFSYEGIFRQDRIVKGRNRDTAWFSIIDKEWPEIKPRFSAWLDPQNFDENEQQKERLAARRV